MNFRRQRQGILSESRLVVLVISENSKKLPRDFRSQRMLKKKSINIPHIYFRLQHIGAAYLYQNSHIFMDTSMDIYKSKKNKPGGSGARR